jgi:inner membrane protein
MAAVGDMPTEQFRATLRPVDPVTHALSGALLARATAPKKARIPVSARVAAGLFAALFPDVDWVLNLVSPVAYLTGHRGVTHSVVLLPFWAALLAWVCARVDRARGSTWRDYFGVCALGVGIHILGDLITAFGTIVFAPLSDARLALSTTFIIDLWFTGIILAGLAASGIWRRSRLPAALGMATLVGYVGLQAAMHSRAVDFGVEYARTQGLAASRIEAVPRPVSPFNWMIVIDTPERYHYAFVNLVRDRVPPAPTPQTGFIARLDAAYRPLDAAQWLAADKMGPTGESRELARRALDSPQLAFYRWFAEYPVLFRIDRANPSTCVWFEDLRFETPGRDANIFRFGLCSEGDSGAWRAYRLRDDGTREPARG